MTSTLSNNTDSEDTVFPKSDLVSKYKVAYMGSDEDSPYWTKLGNSINAAAERYAINVTDEQRLNDEPRNVQKQRDLQSQRDFARKSGIPRSTLRHWIARKQGIDADRQLTDFLESPVGIAFLHRLVAAAHFEFTKNGTASIHNVSNFLKMAGISPFIASSYSTQRRVPTDVILGNCATDGISSTGSSSPNCCSKATPSSYRSESIIKKATL